MVLLIFWTPDPTSGIINVWCMDIKFYLLCYVIIKLYYMKQVLYDV